MNRLAPRRGLQSSDSEVNNKPKTKQRRKKPTLNCSECVIRKSKCDRGRPTCVSCLRRQTTCEYSKIADILLATQPSVIHEFMNADDSNVASRGRAASMADSTSPPFYSGSTLLDFHAMRHPEYNIIRQPVQSKERRAPFKFLGMGSRHLFQNYWTSDGGLAEVIGVLPSKDHADLLLSNYFDSVDPLYPIISRAAFELEYERFWSLSVEERCKYDAAQLALQFVIYAAGTQFIEEVRPEERVYTAEFYLSASHQSLCIFSYLNRFSIPTIQTMVLICYFLISNNHVSDAYTFSGITQRQAYGLELNRNLELMRPDLSFREKQQRYKLWQSIMFQDTSLSMYLELPPTAVYYDLQSSCLCSEEDLREDDFEDSNGLGNILRACLPQDISAASDVAYLRAMWGYASFLQSNICVARSLNRPVSRDSAHKAQLISEFRSLYRSWDEPFNSYDASRFELHDQRLVKQLISISSNYFYVLTILYMDKNEDTGVQCDIYGALDAAHEAMAAFFALARLYPVQLDVWGAYHTRGYSQAMMIGTILGAQKKPSSMMDRDARLMLAKSDFDRYLDIIMRARGTADYEAIQAERIANLRALRETIKVA